VAWSDVKKVLLFPGDAEPAARAELLAAAHRLYGRSRYETTCVTADPGPRKGDEDSGSHRRGIVEALDELHRDVGFDAILFRGSHLSGMLAPRLAARLGAGLVTDVVDIRHHEGGVAFVRRLGPSELLVRVTSRAGSPLIVAMRPGAFPRESMRREATHTMLLAAPTEADAQVGLVGRRPKDPPTDIRDAEILISGGGGILGSFDELQKLATAMGGHVAASRRAVDHGVADRALQVGLSGRTVSPRLYVAIGIDGAGQHIEGLRDIESIISVNTNRHAPICSISDVVVEGDATEFIERLCRRLAEGTMAAPEP
jgi:electron transfer flavoprotein alpha subunit